MDADFHALLLTHETSWTVESDEHWQDATCAASLSAVADDGRDAMIRFSTFGDMAVIFCWKEGTHLPEPSPLEPPLIPLVLAAGFTVIPPDRLAQPYGGLHGSFPGIFGGGPIRWFERYSDDS